MISNEELSARYWLIATRALCTMVQISSKMGYQISCFLISSEASEWASASELSSVKPVHEWDVWATEAEEAIEGMAKYWRPEYCLN